MVSNVDATEEEEELIRAIGSAQSNVLAAYVVLYRSLGMFKNVAIACMEELARRRSVGENFDYETYIEIELNKLPKIQPLDLDMVKGLLNVQAITKMIKGVNVST